MVDVVVLAVDLEQQDGPAQVVYHDELPVAAYLPSQDVQEKLAVVVLGAAYRQDVPGEVVLHVALAVAVVGAVSPYLSVEAAQHAVEPDVAALQEVPVVVAEVEQLQVLWGLTAENVHGPPCLGGDTGTADYVAYAVVPAVDTDRLHTDADRPAAEQELEQNCDSSDSSRFCVAPRHGPSAGPSVAAHEIPNH